MPARWSRRSVLGLGLVGAAGLLTGCTEEAGRERTGSTEPPARPSVPAAVPDVPALLLALERTRELHAAASGITEARGRRAWLLGQAVAGLGEQDRVLQEVLTAGRVPVPPAPDPPASTVPADQADRTRPPDDAQTTTVSPRERERAERERAERVEQATQALAARCAEAVGTAELAELSTVSSANLAMLTSLAGHRGAFAMALGADLEWPALPGPSGAVAGTMLPSFQAASYALEVLAARSGDDERRRYEAVLTRLRRLTRGLTSLAGDAAPPPPLGYGVDADLGSAAGRADLARQVLVALPPAVVAAAGAHTGDENAVAGTVRLLAEVVELASRWELEVAPFPGMTVP